MTRVFLTISMALFSCLVFSQETQFVFRNDDRPSFQKLVTASELVERQTQENLVILDVRLKEDFEKDPQLIPGATYMDPEKLQEWSSLLSSDAEIVVYCVAGKWVSQKVAFLLDQQGLSVSGLAGGIEAWKQSNKP